MTFRTNRIEKNYSTPTLRPHKFETLLTENPSLQFKILYSTFFLAIFVKFDIQGVQKLPADISARDAGGCDEYFLLITFSRISNRLGDTACYLVVYAVSNVFFFFCFSHSPRLFHCSIYN